MYCARADEGDDDGDHVDRQLKLEKLGDRVVDVSAPHDGLHDAAEVVVSQNDVGGLLSDVSAGDTLCHQKKELAMV